MSDFLLLEAGLGGTEAGVLCGGRMGVSCLCPHSPPFFKNFIWVTPVSNYWLPINVSVCLSD